VARRAKNIGVPVIAVVGDVENDIDEVYQEGVTGIFSTNQLAIPFHEAKLRSKQDYRFTISNLMRLVRISLNKL
jgi:glycerate kinase